VISIRVDRTDFVEASGEPTSDGGRELAVDGCIVETLKESKHSGIGGSGRVQGG